MNFISKFNVAAMAAVMASLSLHASTKVTFNGYITSTPQLLFPGMSASAVDASSAASKMKVKSCDLRSPNKIYSPSYSSATGHWTGWLVSGQDDRVGACLDLFDGEGSVWGSITKCRRHSRNDDIGGQYASGLPWDNDSLPLDEVNFTICSDANYPSSGYYVGLYDVSIYFAMYTVTFVDKDGVTLKTEGIAQGGTATPPSVPEVSGMTFTGWSKTLSNITSDMTVQACYIAIGGSTASFSGLH